MLSASFVYKMPTEPLKVTASEQQAKGHTRFEAFVHPLSWGTDTANEDSMLKHKLNINGQDSIIDEL